MTLGNIRVLAVRGFALVMLLSVVTVIILRAPMETQPVRRNIEPIVVLDGKRIEHWAGGDANINRLEIDFEQLLMGQFAANPLCHGVKIATTETGFPANLMNERQWTLTVQHTPPLAPDGGREQNSWVWMLNEDRGSERAASFMFNEGTAKGIAADVCAIVTAQGAVVLSK